MDIKKGMYGLEKDKYPANMGKPWLDDEILQLLQEIRKKKTIEEIAEQHQRTIGGINSRLKELAADYHNEGRAIEDIQKFTGLTAEQVKDAIERRRVGEIGKKRREENRATGKPYTQAEVQPSMKDIMIVLKDVQRKLAMILEKNT
jgi:hypothetical protein